MQTHNLLATKQVDSYVLEIATDWTERNKFAYSQTLDDSVTLECAYNDDVDVCFEFNVSNNALFNSVSIYANCRDERLSININASKKFTKKQVSTIATDIAKLFSVTDVQLRDDTGGYLNFTAL